MSMTWDFRETAHEFQNIPIGHEEAFVRGRCRRCAGPTMVLIRPIDLFERMLGIKAACPATGARRRKTKALKGTEHGERGAEYHVGNH